MTNGAGMPAGVWLAPLTAFARQKIWQALLDKKSPPVFFGGLRFRQSVW
jgi:hypothetical protein